MSLKKIPLSWTPFLFSLLVPLMCSHGVNSLGEKDGDLRNSAPNQVQDSAPSPALGSLFSLYGWKTPDQQRAINNLLKRAGIREEEIIKNTGAERLLTFLRLTQGAFFRRNPGQERQDLTTTLWMEDHKEENRRDLQTLGFYKKNPIKTEDYDVVMVLGSSCFGMKKRLCHVLDQPLKEGAPVVFLTGDREVSFVDGMDEEKKNRVRKILQSDPQELAPKIHMVTESHGSGEYIYNSTEPLKETDLAAYLYRIHALPQGHDYYLLHTLRGDLPRPTTETTVAHAINWIIQNKLQDKSILFISDFPYLPTQEATIENVLMAKNVYPRYALGGPEAPEDVEIFRVLSELGAYIHAKTGFILAHMEDENISQNTREAFLDIYKNQVVLLPYLRNRWK